jgi:4-carboxymuconolactone decarboxylase
VIDAIARNERPKFEKDDEVAIYDYLTELYETHTVSDTTHARAKDLFGVPGVVELTLLSGYYGMVAMTLLAHGMPLPEGVKPPLAKR